MVMYFVTYERQARNSNHRKSERPDRSLAADICNHEHIILIMYKASDVEPNSFQRSLGKHDVSQNHLSGNRAQNISAVQMGGRDPSTTPKIYYVGVMMIGNFATVDKRFNGYYLYMYW